MIHELVSPVGQEQKIGAMSSDTAGALPDVNAERTLTEIIPTPEETASDPELRQLVQEADAFSIATGFEGIDVDDTMALYKREACSSTRPTESESRTLLIRLADGRSPDPDPHAKDRYIVKYTEDAAKAREELIIRNQRLVLSVAWRYESLYGFPYLLDAVQNGNIGLMIGLSRVDPEKSEKFSTYAVWWIKQQILVGYTDTERTIRVPQDAGLKSQKAKEILHTFSEHHGRQPSNSELVTLLGWPHEKVYSLRVTLLEPKSLQDKVLSPGNSKVDELGEGISTDDSAEIEQIELAEQMGMALNTLRDMGVDPRRQTIFFESIMGTDDEEPSLTKVGRKYGFTREWVRQIRDGVLHKLIDSSKEKNIL